MVLDKLYVSKQEIEKDFGTELSWQRLEGKKSCRVAARLEDVNVQNFKDWEKMIDFHCKAMPKFFNAIHARLIEAVKM